MALRARTTAGPKPTPRLLTKRSSPTRPTSNTLASAVTRRPTAVSGEQPSTPTSFAKSLPVPSGTTPSGTPPPEASRPFATSWTVPSPPTATTRCAPLRTAAAASAAPSPGPPVRVTSTAQPCWRKARATGSSARPPAPRPAAGLTMTWAEIRGYKIGDDRRSVDRDRFRLSLGEPARLRALRRGRPQTPGARGLLHAAVRRGGGIPAVPPGGGDPHGQRCGELRGAVRRESQHAGDRVAPRPRPRGGRGARGRRRAHQSLGRGHARRPGVLLVELLRVCESDHPERRGAVPVLQEPHVHRRLSASLRPGARGGVAAGPRRGAVRPGRHPHVLPRGRETALRQVCRRRRVRRRPRGGGSVWESNPPRPLRAPAGFEDRSDHQAQSAPAAPGKLSPIFRSVPHATRSR